MKKSNQVFGILLAATLTISVAGCKKTIPGATTAGSTSTGTTANGTSGSGTNSGSTGVTTVNLTPGTPVVNGASGGTFKDSSGNITATVGTAPKASLTVTANLSEAKFCYSTLPAWGHGGNIDKNLTPYFYVNRLGRGVEGKWDGNCAVFGGPFLPNDRGNAYFAGNRDGGTQGAVWAQLEGQNGPIVQDPDASQKLHVKFP